LESLETGHEITDDYVDLLMNKLDVDMKGYITVDDLIGAFKNMSEINLNHHEKDDIFSDDHQSESLEDIFVTKNHHKQDDEDFEIVPDDEYNSLVKNSGEDKNVKVLKNENNYLKNRLSTLESEVTKLHESSEGQYKKIQEQQQLINHHKVLLKKHESVEEENYTLTEETEKLKSIVKKLEEDVKILQSSKKLISIEKNQLREKTSRKNERIS